MKKIAIFIALFLFLRPLLPLGEYVFNYNYIVKELCVNKDKPVMHCNGKCHLMKELAKQAADENPASEKKTATAQFEILALIQEPVAIPAAPVVVYNTAPSTIYSNLYSHLYNPVFLRPPGLV